MAVWSSPLLEATEIPGTLSSFPCVGEARWRCLGHGWMPSPGQPDSGVQACLSSLRDVGGCARSVFRSKSTGAVDLSPRCCGAVQRMGEPCFTKVFGSDCFGDSFAPTITEFCALQASAAAGGGH
ncbi:hypothetical protein BHE74_00037363 [Ensete ventricosum]|nr:hypothetical protein BHE74_00037363 [Ensete ventricosum]RZS13562.1 hypothetical protein BHM03_00045163 [Ensete ventricosum]